jgi:hypothetical protein
MHRDALYQELSRLGMHQRDIVEYLRFADREYLLAHPEEPDPGEFVNIELSEKGWRAWAERRDGFSIESAETRDGLLSRLVARGFERDAVTSLMDQAEASWNDDVRHNRSQFGTMIIGRRGDGYLWRLIGAGRWHPDRPLTRPEVMRLLTRTIMLSEQQADALIERADREWAAGTLRP